MCKAIQMTIVFFLMTSAVLADGKNVISEYTSTEVYYKFQNKGDVDPTRMLERNVRDAMKVVVQRHFPNQPDLVRKVYSDDIAYEQILGSRVVIAKFEDHLFELRYSSNPRKYIQLPISHKVMKIPVDKRLAPELNTANNS